MFWYEKSINILDKAFSLDPTDGLTLLYLGSAHEILGNYQEAIDKYRRYSQVSRLSHHRKSLEGKLHRLVLKQIEKETKTAKKPLRPRIGKLDELDRL